MQDIGHYISIPDALMLVPTSILKHQARMLWGAIHDRQGDNASAWPSIKTLGFEAGVARGEVTKYLSQLVELELIEKIRGQTTNRYRVKLPPILLQAARDVKALPPRPEGGFDVDAAEKIAAEATKQWLASLGHHESIKLPLAGTPASEVPELRHPGHRNPGIGDAGVPATNLPKASPFNPPSIAPAPAPPSPAAGGISRTASPREQTPEQMAEDSSSAKSEHCLTAKNSGGEGERLSIIRALQRGLACKRRPDQWAKLAASLMADGCSESLVEQACRRANEAHAPLTAALITGSWMRWAYTPGILNDDEKAIVASSVDRMNRYLQFGREAAIDLKGTYPAGSMNWTAAPGYTQDAPNAASWSVSHFVGYYWFLVSWYRNQFGLDLSFPDFGQIAREVRRFLSTNSKESLHTHFRNLVGHFPVVVYGLRNSTTVSVTLNERTINNPICSDKISAYLNLGPDERRDLREKARAYLRGEAVSAA